MTHRFLTFQSRKSLRSEELSYIKRKRFNCAHIVFFGTPPAQRSRKACL